MSSFLERIGITVPGALLLGFSVLGWGVARIWGGRAVFLLVYGAIMVLAGSWLLGRRSRLIAAKRSRLPSRVPAGQPVEVVVELQSKRRLGGVIVEETLPPALGFGVRIPVPSLPSGNAIRRHYTFTPRRRGVHEVGPLSASWIDPFGLTIRRAELAPASKIIVHPAIEPVWDRVLSREWADPPIRPPRSRPSPIGYEFAGMREYVPGDDPRRIVWRASARTIDPLSGMGTYMVREAEQGITDRIFFLLDTDSNRHSEGDPSETFETAVKTVASLAVRYLRDGFMVTIETNKGMLLSGLRGPRNRIKILDELARISPDQIPLEKGLDNLLAARRQNIHQVIVTPYLGSEAARRAALVVGRGRSTVIAFPSAGPPDVQSRSRAAALGCDVVDLSAEEPLATSFGRIVGAGMHRLR